MPGPATRARRERRVGALGVVLPVLRQRAAHAAPRAERGHAVVARREESARFAVVEGRRLAAWTPRELLGGERVSELCRLGSQGSRWPRRAERVRQLARTLAEEGPARGTKLVRHRVRHARGSGRGSVVVERGVRIGAVAEHHHLTRKQRGRAFARHAAHGVREWREGPVRRERAHGSPQPGHRSRRGARREVASLRCEVAGLLEVKVEAVLGGEPRDELEVGLGVLRAVLAHRERVAEPKAAWEPVFAENPRDHLIDADVLEDP